MSNHYHILVQTPDGKEPKAMRHINGVHIQCYNRSRNIDGQLFRGGYKSFFSCLQEMRYIHSPPLIDIFLP
jgi:REP element-mobilizing transposase RayT